MFWNSLQHPRPGGRGSRLHRPYVWEHYVRRETNQVVRAIACPGRAHVNVKLPLYGGPSKVQMGVTREMSGPAAMVGSSDGGLRGARVPWSTPPARPTAPRLQFRSPSAA